MKKILNILSVFFIGTLSSSSVVSCTNNKIDNNSNDEIDTKTKIAHAGGSIKGYKYTNSLESLNLSYENGLRYFELDLDKTSDGKIVAVHDWEKWKKMTNYKGEIPTLKEFNSLLLYNEFAPLDWEKINLWFQQHIDAILITDKINKPKEIVSTFVDKKRLQMEPFSTTAINEANNIDFDGVMINYWTLARLDEPSEYIKKHKIKYVVSGVPTDDKRMSLLKELKKDNVKIFMYFLDMNRDFIKALTNNLWLIDGFYTDITKW